MTMTEILVENLSEYCVRNKTHYTELRGFINSYKRTRKKNINTEEVIGNIRRKLQEEYPEGFM